MSVRAIDPSGDWTFGKGRNDYLRENDEVAQNLTTRLRSFLGDCFFAIDEGLDWFNLLGSKNQQLLEVAVRTVILNTTYVTGIRQLSITLDAQRSLELVYIVTTVFTGTVRGVGRYLLTEDGFILVTEDGDPLHV